MCYRNSTAHFWYLHWAERWRLKQADLCLVVPSDTCGTWCSESYSASSSVLQKWTILLLGPVIGTLSYYLSVIVTMCQCFHGFCHWSYAIILDSMRNLMFIVRPTHWDMKVLHGNKMLKTLIQLYGTSYRTDSSSLI